VTECTGHFVCEHCKRAFIRSRSDEEMEAEERSVFGKNAPEDDRVIVCDDCYTLLMSRYRRLS
jgi:hypothetical protein